jgi:hypothetical protein
MRDDVTTIVESTLIIIATLIANKFGCAQTIMLKHLF